MSENPAGETPLAADDASAMDESARPVEQPAAPNPVEPVEISLAAQVEGLLFVASEPVTSSQLAEALDVSPSSVDVALKELERELRLRGLRLQRHAGRVMLTTAPELAPAIENFLGLEATSRLTRAALETLAIIAYQQPITHPQIDSIRGVNSDSMLKSLLNKGLIFEAGRAEGPGRPILYVTSPTFLQHLGLNSIAELPALELAEETSEHDEMLKG